MTSIRKAVSTSGKEKGLKMEPVGNLMWRLVVKDKDLRRPGVVHLASPAELSNNFLRPCIRTLRLSLGDKFPQVEIQVVPTTHLQGQVTEKLLNFVKSSPLVLNERHFGTKSPKEPTSASHEMSNSKERLKIFNRMKVQSDCVQKKLSIIRNLTSWNAPLIPT